MKITIIGNGRITLALVKEIMNEGIMDKVSSVIIYSRKCIGLKDGKCRSWIDTTYEDILNMYLEEKCKQEHKENCIQFRYYDSLGQLAEIGNNSSKEDLLILDIKYNMDELEYIDKECTKKIDLDNEEHLKLLSLRFRYFNVDKINQKDYTEIVNKEILIRKSQSLRKQTVNLEKAIKELEEQTTVGYERLYNLKNSIIGIVNLGQAINTFKGTIFNMINEIDVTNWFLIKLAGISEESLLSPCENDSLRARYFLQKKVGKYGIEVKELSLDYLGPHNHNGFFPLESVYLDGKSFAKYFEKYPEFQNEEFRVSVMEDVNSFGEKVYLKKGSSDEDTVICLIKAIMQYVNQDNKYYRASIYVKEYDCFTGMPVICRNNKIEPKYNIFDKFSKNVTNRFIDAICEQKIICNKLLECITT